MNRKTQALIAIGGAAAGFLAVRTLATKRILTLPYGHGIKIKIEEALRKFKGFMEAGEISTAADEKKATQSVEVVEVASEDSFPASDAPAWTGTTGPI